MSVKPYLIAPVCTGNICRSAMAEVVLKQRLVERGLIDQFEVDSFGVSNEERGNPIDRRAAAELRARGYDVPRRAAQQITAADLKRPGLFLPMTASHVRRMGAIGEATNGVVRMWRSFEPSFVDANAADVPDLADPWFGGPEDFTLALDQIEASADAIIDYALTLP